MARPLRIEFAGALYHVTSRGNEKRTLFEDDNDFARRLTWLARTIDTYGWRIHAFVLMTNHDHLFVETPEPNLAAGTQFLNGSYTGYFNFRHHRVGHLFQGRYKAVLIQKQGHYREISRYIHLNPVRAGLVERPEDWPWSSYPGYHWLGKRLSWVTYDRVLTKHGSDEVRARQAYRRFVRAGMQTPPDSPLAEALHGLILGSERFVEKIKRYVENRREDPATPALRRLRDRPSLAKIIDAASGHWGIDASQWTPGRRSDHIARAVAAYLARIRFGHPATRIADALGFSHPSSVNQAVKRIQSDLNRLSPLLKKIEKRCTKKSR